MKNTKKQAQFSSAVEKRRRRFNFIDLLLIIFVLAVVFVAINIVSPTSLLDKLKKDSVHTIQYTVEFTGVDKSYIDKIGENDTVVDSVSKQNFGSVATVDNNTKYTVLEYNEADDSALLAEHPDKYNLIVTITATATYREGRGYSIGEQRIAVGEKLSLRFPDFAYEGYCINLSVVS